MSADYFRQVTAAALGRFDEVMLWLGLGGGQNQGQEYLPHHPKRSDHKTGSFAVNRNTGKWADFASGDRGGDLVALAAWIWDMGQGEAASQLGKNLCVAEPSKQHTDAPKDKGKWSTLRNV